MKTVPLIILALSIQLTAKATSYYPHTDPGNLGNWVYQEQCSDEFDGTVLDENKWQVCGRDGVYWAGQFKGRTYNTNNTGGVEGGWQYSPDNLQVSNGLLRITTEYDPDYDWYEPGDDVWTHTTGGMWSKALSAPTGYMEIRCKLADASVVGAFWTTAGPSNPKCEIDVFEAIGSPTRNTSRIGKMWSSLHDWTMPNPNSAWTETTQLGFDFKDGFHTYAAEWGEDYLKIYADGELIHETTRDWVENTPVGGDKYSTTWPLPGGQHIWADAEIFEWWGVPTEASLPADHEIEYIRVWERGPAFLWDEYVSLYGISGTKTNHSDADELDDWTEYLFDGNPTNANDTGIHPCFDPETGQYIYQLRNDASLTAYVLATTNMLVSNWAPVETNAISINDGMMATNYTLVGTTESQLFLKLRVEEEIPPPTYPESKGDDSRYEWIANVHVGTINRSSGNDGGYYDATHLSTAAVKGDTVSVSLTPGFSLTDDELWAIWIDLNRDGDFTDAGEEVFTAGPGQITVSGSFTLPTSYSYTGETRMRVSMKWANHGAPASDEIFFYGEVEDYTFIIE